MIVIATNNGKKYLLESLTILEKFKIQEIISIIDTGSTDVESIQFLELLKNDNPYELNLKIYKTPNKNYDTGAYLFAINNLKSDRYVFLHDSLIIKSYKFFEEIFSKLKPNVVVSILEVHPSKNNNILMFLEEKLGFSEHDSIIFGPMFAITREDVDRIDEKYFIYPNNKQEQMNMEIGWASIFKKYEIKIDSICPITTHFGYNLNRLKNDGYELFKKYNPIRD